MMPNANKATPIRPAPQPKAPPLVYRINVAAEKLGVSRRTIYRLVDAGDLQLTKIGPRASGITVKSINELMERSNPSE